MNLKFCRIALVLLLAGVAFDVKAQSGPAEWKRFELGKGNFSVLFPSEPKEDITSAPPSVGLAIDSYIYAASGANGSFVAQYNLLGEPAAGWTDATREIFLNGVWTGAAASFDKQMETAKLDYRSKLLETRAIKFSGYPGQERVFSLGPYRGRVWSTVIGRQAFVAMALGTEQSLADQQKFLESFTIKLVPLDTPKKNPAP